MTVSIASPWWRVDWRGRSRATAITRPPIDLNLLPAAYLAPRVRPGRAVLWLLILVVSGLLIGLALDLSTRWQTLETTRAAVRASEAAVVVARQEMALVRQRQAEAATTRQVGLWLLTVSETIQRRRVAWAPLLRVAWASAGPDVTLVGLTGGQGMLEIDGHAPSTEVVLAYARRLQASGVFASVVVASIGGGEAPPGRRAFRVAATLPAE